MYKDILVHIPSVQSARPVIGAALSLAKRGAGRVDAVAFGYEPVVAQVALDGAAAVATVLEVQQERALEQADAVLSVFEAEAKLSGVTYALRSFTAAPADAPRIIGELSRLYELTVVTQPEPGRSIFDDLIPQSALFNSGGPILIIPYVQKDPVTNDSVLICWNGSREAARAVRDAMPFIVAAKSVRIIAVNERRLDAGEATARALVVHLARQGVASDVEEVTGSGSDVYNSILSRASDYGADLLVMGGYGHSRLREIILGGVTRGVFETMTVPVLMSH